MTSRGFTAALLGVLLAGAALAQAPTEAPGETVRIPMTEPGGGRLTLEGTLYRPAGVERSPVLLFNHGSTGGGAVLPTTTLPYPQVAAFFVERGFAVLAPMRRGRGASEGLHMEGEGTCEPDSLAPGFARAVEDVDAALAYVRSQPWADTDRLLIGGQSRGGILSVAYAGMRPDSARGVINFAGGWTSGRCDTRPDNFNQATFAAAGRRARVPTVWLYAEGDRYYPPESIRRYHAAFVQAGGEATFHLFPAFGANGHRLVDHVQIWRTAADEFLRRLNLVAR